MENIRFKAGFSCFFCYDESDAFLSNCTGQDSEQKAMDFLRKRVRRCIVKSKTVQKSMVELTVEIRIKDEDTDFINTISGMNGVNSAVLVSYNGDYMG